MLTESLSKEGLKKTIIIKTKKKNVLDVEYNSNV
jgi:hypothetical protein